MREILTDARRVADYVVEQNVDFVHHSTTSRYCHVGALFTDIILQAGLNYRSVVLPRVQRVLVMFPETQNVCALKSCLDSLGAKLFLNWQDSVKINRLESLVSFVLSNNVHDESDFGAFLWQQSNRIQLRSLNGIGDKTIDYALKLMGFDCVAVDRHIISFINEAGIEAKNYQHVKKIVEFAADLLQMSRSSIDATIWNHMSSKTSRQCEFEMSY